MKELFPKEEEIMYAIWEIGHPCIISEILKIRPSLNRNTVTKLIPVLQKKGYLKVDSIGKSATRTGRAYVPNISREAYEEQKQLFYEVIKSQNAKSGILTFFSSLIQSKDTDPEFISEIEQMINDYKKQNLK